MRSDAQLDFGYPWCITYRRLVLAVPAPALWLVARRRKWPKVVPVLAGAVLLWAAAVFAVSRFVSA